MRDLHLVAAVIDDVVDAFRHRDAGDPDSPAWEAEIRIERTFASLVALLPPVEAARQSGAPARLHRIAEDTIRP